MNTAIIYTILSILFMSFGPTINKFALLNVNPFTLVFYNSLICCLFTLPFIYKKILSINRDEIIYLVVAGILNGLSMFFLFYGLNKSSPALVSMLNRSYIVFSIFLGAFLLKEKIAKIDWGLIIFAVLGIILFMFKKEMAQMQAGALYGLVSGLLFSFCNFTIKNKLSKTSEYITLFSINFITALIFFFVCLAQGFGYLTLPLESKVLAFVFLGSFLGSFLGLLLFYASIKTIPFYKANLYRSISPVISLICGLFFFPVFLTSINIIGLIILLAAFITHSLIKVKIMKPTQVSASEFNKLEIVKTNIVPESYKSVLVFIKSGKEWLMVKNKFRNWEFPGGHREGGETLYETAQREAFEEAGVDIKNVVYVGYYRLLDGHTTLIVTAEVEKFHEIPSDFETEERKFVSEFPAKLSFNDAVYPWLVSNFMV
jgi:drug/metabolite transporter (DMT)-like permease/8-oxo-dGTP pyrophosphatase MutT (NUDIX family)